MANILSLAVRVTGDASGLQLTPVEKALQRLQQESDKTSAIFEKFAQSSELGAKAQETFNAASSALLETLKAGTITRDEFVRQFAELEAGARATAAALAEGQRVTEANRTEEERRAIAVEKLNQLLAAGGIEQETYNRAVAEASGANAEAARVAEEAARRQAELLAEGQRITEANRTDEEKRAIAVEKLNNLLAAGVIEQETYNRAVAEASGANAEAARQQAEQEKQLAEAQRARQSLEARAAAIINANLTAQEQYEQKLAEINALQREGLFTQEQYNRAVAAARKPLDDAAAAAERAAEANRNSTLQFNELSGVFAVLPGPLGNIAGRISGITSASEGLTRIFSGGLRAGFSGITSSITSLATSTNIVLGGLAAFGAASSALASSLVALEDRVEKLGRLSDQLGVSFEFVQVLEEAGNRADVSVQQISASFARLQNTLAGTDEEGKKASASLSRLGISLEEFGQLSQEQQIELIGEKLAGIEDPAQRSAAAIALFGRSGVQLLPFFNELGLAADDIERFGRAITDIDRQRLSELGGGLDALGVASQGLGVSLTLPFVELGESIARALADVISGVTAIVDPLGRALQPLLAGLGQALQTIGAIVNFGGRIIGAVVQPLARFVEGFSPAAAAANDTAKAIESVRKEAAKPANTKLFRDIESEATRTNRLLSGSAREIGVAGQEAGVAYIRLIESIRIARLSFDRTTPEGAERFLRSVQQANDAYEKQVRLIKEANDARLAQIKSEQDIVNKLLEQQRIEQQFGGDSRRAQSAEAAAALTAEIRRLESRLSDIRNTGTQEEDNLQAQIANLEQLRRTEIDIASGRAQRREAEYERERERVQAIADERERVEREAEERIAQQRQTINEFVNEQLALQQFNGDSQRLQAQRNVLAIEEEMRRVEQEGAQARVRNDAAGVQAAVQRLQQLDQIAAKEADIASGRAAQEAEIAKAREAAIAQQQKNAEAFSKAQEQQAAQAQQAQQKRSEEFQAALQAQAEENERVLANRRQLATASNQAAQGADIRTSEGANAFIQAVQGGFDPQLAVQRQQLKVQQRIAVGLEANLNALGFQTFRFPAAAGA